MTAVLLALVIAQPAPDESSRVVQDFSGQMGEAIRIMSTDPDGAIRQLNALLDDPKGRELEDRFPNVRAFREQALYFRELLQLQHGQAQSVADDMTTLLDHKREASLSQIAGLIGTLASPLPDASLGAAFRLPSAAALIRMDCYQALGLRAEAYRVLGRHDEEQADRAEATEILTEMSRNLAAYPYPSEEDDGPDETSWGLPSNLYRSPFADQARQLVSWASGPLFVAALFVVMLPFFFLTGLRQRAEAGGSWRRLFWVSLALAALQTAPVLAAVLLLRWHPWYMTAVPVVAPLVFLYIMVRHCAYLGAVRLVRSRTAPPLLEDAAVLGRVAQIAGDMGVAPPVPRLVRSTKP
jgi:hypothetical protein